MKTEFTLSFETEGAVQVILTGQNLENIEAVSKLITEEK